ncbi:hypothetical protein NC653_004790 [Populus alba x Populus x berolinensis]|uniref:Uncharacterized protein n=1 Tax=Populus alba x Populus x berolinensis TaxID=444605 RepID=A0AAD6RVV6_9ROSI|nr:hypothetical protein NC653_004790 [Populus alba x Populus x berolinensis]
MMRQTWRRWRRRLGVLKCPVSFGEHQNWLQLAMESRSSRSCLPSSMTLYQWIPSLSSVSQSSLAANIFRAVILLPSTKSKTAYILLVVV